MGSKKIYVVRHGQTDYNLKGVVQGSGIDAPINENGQKQAAAFYEEYKHIPFDRIYYSGLIRTRQSIERFINGKVPHESIPELNEISWGKYEGLPMDHQENEYYHNMLKKWASGELDHKIDGGESPLDVAIRLRKAFDHIVDNGGSKILVCMHGRAIRILMSVLLNYELRYMDVFKHENLCCYELTQYADRTFRMDAYRPTPVLIKEELTKII
ncbi:histidine phosphatase family protein [Negadavirga shengliensis]|uniref:Histidine phosphatase family protein n=1 Tax=Negadavirga shengliensis TaxID=1389218 RepID=A0ABV9T257_9BACT